MSLTDPWRDVPLEREDAGLDLRRFGRVLGAHKLLLAVTTIAALGVAIAFTMLPAREWSASATLQVQPTAALVSGSVRSDDLTYTDRLINTYSTLVSSREFAASVRRRARLSATPALSVVAPANTNLLGVKATTGSAGEAVEAADTAARLLLAQVRARAASDLRAMDAAFEGRVGAIENDIAAARLKLDQLGTPRTTAQRRQALKLQAQVAGGNVSMDALRRDFEAKRDTQVARASSISVTGAAERPTVPQSRHLKVVVPLGLILGLLAGAVLAFASENMSRRFRSPIEIEAALAAPVLAEVPRQRGASKHTLFSTGSRGEEAIRRLRTQLLLPDATPVRRVLLASAEPREGKSTIAANLACAFAHAGRSVVLLDCDLRAPTIHRFFGLPHEIGLSDLLVDPDGVPAGTWRRYARDVGRTGLTVIPAGDPVADAATLVGSPAMQQLVEELSATFDVVVADSPALLAVSDALALSPLFDTVLLVAGADVSPDALSLAHRQLARAGATPRGLVVNGGDEGPVLRYERYLAARA